MQYEWRDVKIHFLGFSGKTTTNLQVVDEFLSIDRQCVCVCLIVCLYLSVYESLS